MYISNILPFRSIGIFIRKRGRRLHVSDVMHVPHKCEFLQESVSHNDHQEDAQQITVQKNSAGCKLFRIAGNRVERRIYEQQKRHIGVTNEANGVTSPAIRDRRR